MPKFILVFGRNKLLSMLEAASLLNAQSLNFEIECFSENAGVFKIEKFNPAIAASELGGTVKIAEVTAEAESIGELLEKTSRLDVAEDFGKKFYYSINDYGKNPNEELISAIAENLKQEFKKKKLKAMLKWPKEIEGERKKTISPRLLAKRSKEHLDLCCFESNGKVFFGKTIAIGNPEEFKERDLGRPVQKHEIETSIRLARILANLAGLEKGKTILDPFCGIGTVMQEIMLSRHNAIGNELNKENAGDCGKNLNWAKKKFSRNEEFKIFNNDSRKLSAFLHKGSFQAVVTEPYLGPLLRKLPSKQTAEKTIKELNQLYSQVFKELAKLMMAGEKIVIILPQIPTIEGKKLKVSETVFLNNGFKVYNLLEKEIPEFLPYLYKDKESRIERLIYVLEKQ